MEFLQWDSQDVGKWIQQIGFPQYEACFTENYITGRKLIFVNCSTLPRMGITDFKHIQVISANVHKLLGISKAQTNPGFNNPPDLMRLFLERKGETGERADNLTYHNFLAETQDLTE